MLEIISGAMLAADFAQRVNAALGRAPLLVGDAQKLSGASDGALGLPKMNSRLLPP